MRKILHWSDLHIGASERNSRVLDAMVSYTRAMFAPESVVIVITGDLTEGTLNPFTQRKHWRQMDEARKLLEPLVKAGFVLVVVPGNHDHGPRGATYIARGHRREFRRRVLRPLMPWTDRPWAPEYVDEELAIIGLDSTAGKAGFGVDLARGRFGFPECARLSQWLITHEDKHRVAAWHHNTEYDLWTNALEDEDEVLGILKKHGCGLVLQGHEHVERTRSDLAGVGLMYAAWRTTENGEFMAFDGLKYERHIPAIPA